MPIKCWPKLSGSHGECSGWKYEIWLRLEVIWMCWIWAKSAIRVILDSWTLHAWQPPQPSKYILLYNVAPAATRWWWKKNENFYYWCLFTRCYLSSSLQLSVSLSLHPLVDFRFWFSTKSEKNEKFQQRITTKQTGSFKLLFSPLFAFHVIAAEK